MVETGAGGFHQPDYEALASDLIPDVDDTRDLGAEDKRWAALWVAIALVTSITIGGVVNISTIDSWLFINASTWINESLNVSGNITASNITADYFFGDGSQLTGVTAEETLWNANYSDYLVTAAYALNDSLWSLNYSDYLTTKNYALNDSLWSLNYSTFLTHITWANAVNGTLAEMSDIIGFGYYNLTDFSIADYLLDTTDTFTGNLTFADANNCIIFASGGKICSGV